jgi:co-chaperonin GroES (HSP10)
MAPIINFVGAIKLKIIIEDMGDIRTFRQKRMHYNLNNDIKDIDQFQPISNMVLVRIAKKTDIDNYGFLVWKGTGNAVQHSERVVEIIRIPKTLYFNPKDRSKSLSNKTTIEIKKGDIAIINHLEALNSWIFKFNEEEYYLIRYDSIVVIKRGNKIIPVNGYVLLEESKDTLKFLEFEKVVVNKRYGYIKYLGKINQDYARNYDQRGNKLKNGKIWSDYGYEEMALGDKIAFESKRLGSNDPIWRLEHKQHSIIGEYLVCQRPRICAIMKE